MHTNRTTWAIVLIIAVSFIRLPSTGLTAADQLGDSSPYGDAGNEFELDGALAGQEGLNLDYRFRALQINTPDLDASGSEAVSVPPLAAPSRSAVNDGISSGFADTLLPAPHEEIVQGYALNVAPPWWNRQVVEPMQSGTGRDEISVDDLIINALRYAPQIRALSDEALIFGTAIGEACAEFDPQSFMESKFIKTSEPVGNLLQTGRFGRFRESDWNYVAGLRRKTKLGGTLEFSQRLGYQDNNSDFFVPSQQGNARLSLSYKQPLLNGAGRAYNLSLVVLAQIDKGIAWDQTIAELQNQIYQITDSYWQLYFDRAVLLQRQRHLRRAEVIYADLEARREVDALLSQIARARSAVESRRAELIRAATSIRNTETRIRTLVNAPQWQGGHEVELIPTENPTPAALGLTVQEAVTTTLQCRPEIDQAMKQIDAARVRLRVSRNELRPALSLVVESYVSGLEGDSEVGQAFTNQFNQGEPSYTAGLIYERPWRNRAARERNLRRKLELRQLTSRFAATVNDLKQEAEIAVREVNTSYGEIQSVHVAMLAAAADVEFLLDRWQLLPGDDRAASYLLVDLLDAQDRLAIEEFRLAQAQHRYTMSLTELKRATGTLLQFEQISPRLTCEDGLPSNVFEKSTSFQPELN